MSRSFKALDSDEESDLMAQIKDELRAQVRHEVAEDIQELKNSLFQLTKHKAQLQEEIFDQRSEAVDPKIADGLIKIKKYDSLLSKRCAREKAVKRDRLITQRRCREELAALEVEYPDKQRDARANSDRFFQLQLPPSHSNGITIDSDNEEETTPIFQTEMTDMLYKQSKSIGSNMKGKKSTSFDSSNSKSKASGDHTNANKNAKNRKQDSEIDFIRKNVERAADASSYIPMTLEEKERVNDLLKDLDRVDFDEVDGEVAIICREDGDGFRYNDNESDRMRDIDSKLAEIMPPSDFVSVCSTPSMTSQDLATNLSSHSSVSTHRSTNSSLTGGGNTTRLKGASAIKARLTSIFEDTEIENDQNRIGHCSETDDNSTEIGAQSHTSNGSVVNSTTGVSSTTKRYGDKLLQNIREERERQEALTKINDRLSNLRQTHNFETEVPRLDRNELDRLLEHCRSQTLTPNTGMASTRASSPGTQSTASFGTTTSAATCNASVAEPLDDATLGRLLHSARSELGIAWMLEDSGTSQTTLTDSKEKCMFDSNVTESEALFRRAVVSVEEHEKKASLARILKDYNPVELPFYLRERFKKKTETTSDDDNGDNDLTPRENVSHETGSNRLNIDLPNDNEDNDHDKDDIDLPPRSAREALTRIEDAGHDDGETSRRLLDQLSRHREREAVLSSHASFDTTFSDSENEEESANNVFAVRNAPGQSNGDVNGRLRHRETPPDSRAASVRSTTSTRKTSSASSRQTGRDSLASPALSIIGNSFSTLPPTSPSGQNLSRQASASFRSNSTCSTPTLPEISAQKQPLSGRKWPPTKP